MIRIILATLIGVGLVCVFPGTSHAQISQTTVGSCSPNVAGVTGTLQLFFKCDTLVVDKYIYKIDDRQAEVIATYFSITTTAVRNFLQELTGENVPPYQVPEKLARLASRIKNIEERVQSISVADELSSELTRLKMMLQDGNLDEAEKLAELLSQKSNSTNSELIKLLGDKIKIELVNGDLKFSRYKYDDAIPYFKRATVLTPPLLSSLYARARVSFAEALVLGTKNQSERDGAVAAAMASTEPLIQEEPTLRFRAVALKIMELRQTDLDGVVSLFETQIKPLLKRDDVSFTGYVEYCLACVGRAYIDAERPADALGVLEEAERIVKKTLLPDPLGLAAIYQNRFLAYMLLGKRIAGQQALDQAETVLREASPDELNPNFAWLYIDKAALVSGELSSQYRLRALEIADKLYPYNHGTITNILEIALDDGAATSAEIVGKIYKMYVANVQRTLGNEDSVEYIDAIANFGSTVASNGGYALSMTYFRKALGLAETKHAGSGSIAFAYFNAAQIVDDENRRNDKGSNFRSDEAELYYSRAIPLYNSEFGATDERTQQVRKQYIRYFASRGLSSDAWRLESDFAKTLETDSDPSKTKMISELKDWTKSLTEKRDRK
jgi:hypothetical protein